jgi:hypothetical protein
MHFVEFLSKSSWYFKSTVYRVEEERKESQKSNPLLFFCVDKLSV